MESNPSSSYPWLNEVIEDGKTKLNLYSDALDAILRRRVKDCQEKLSSTNPFYFRCTKTVVDEVVQSFTTAIDDLQKQKASIVEEFNKFTTTANGDDNGFWSQSQSSSQRFPNHQAKTEPTSTTDTFSPANQQSESEDEFLQSPTPNRHDPKTEPTANESFQSSSSVPEQPQIEFSSPHQHEESENEDMHQSKTELFVTANEGFQSSVVPQQLESDDLPNPLHKENEDVYQDEPPANEDSFTSSVSEYSKIEEDLNTPLTDEDLKVFSRVEDKSTEEINLTSISPTSQVSDCEVVIIDDDDEEMNSKSVDDNVTPVVSPSPINDGTESTLSTISVNSMFGVVQVEEFVADIDYDFSMEIMPHDINLNTIIESPDSNNSADDMEICNQEESLGKENNQNGEGKSSATAFSNLLPETLDLSTAETQHVERLKEENKSPGMIIPVDPFLWPMEDDGEKPGPSRLFYEQKQISNEINTDEDDVVSVIHITPPMSPNTNDISTEYSDEEEQQQEKGDPKLSKKPVVVLDKLDPEIENELKTVGYIDLCEEDTINGDETESEDEVAMQIRKLDAAIRKLKSCDGKSPSRGQASSKSRVNNAKSNKKRRKVYCDEDSTLDELSDADEGEELFKSPSFGPVLMNARTVHHDEGNLSDLEDVSVIDDPQQGDSYAKHNTRGESKKSGKTYITPSVDIESTSDSDDEDRRNVLCSSSSGEDEVELRPTQSRKKRVVNSESEDKEPQVFNISSSDGEFSDPDFVDTSQLSKNKKAKRKRSSSKFSNTSDSDLEITKRTKRRRYRRRVKVESPEMEDIAIPETEAEFNHSQTRKKIRSIITDDQLQKSTRQAEKEEEDRKRRLAAKDKIFSKGLDETLLDQIEGIQETRLILDIDKETQEPLIEVDESIVRKLKPHQVEGVKFMYNSCFESVDLIKKGKAAGGCILAHCMGLGKTLQTVAFVHTIMAHSEITKTKRVLIICPLSTVTNWRREFVYWLKETPKNTKPKLFNLWDTKTCTRMKVLNEWHTQGGVGIINYDIARRLICSARDIISQKTRKQLANPSSRPPKPLTAYEIETIEKTLLDGCDLVVCDEGHMLRNHESLLSRSLPLIETKRRIILTGTPLQNNLNEYHTMMQFVKPNLLGNLKEFTNRFISPITNGEHKDSSPFDVLLMKKRAHILHNRLAGCVQRKSFEVLTPYLPEKHEYCVVIRPTAFQKELYQKYLELADFDKNSRGRRLFEDYTYLIKIIAHPSILTIEKKKSTASVIKKKQQNDEDALDLLGLVQDYIGTTELNNNVEVIGDEEDAGQAAHFPSNEWWNPYFQDIENPRDINLSSKFVILESIIKECAKIGERLLIFSQFLIPLNLIQEMLRTWDEAAVENNDSTDRWRFGKEFFRIDGSTNIRDRQKFCDKFNKESNEETINESKLFLISTRAGGLGINLFGANRVVIFDASWNPANDMQGIFRVYRLGQKKPCYIYRLLMEGTMEEKIYNRQVVKLSLSSRVVDEHQIERHFRSEDLAEFYKFNPSDENAVQPTLPVPKDNVLADILMTNGNSIVNYFEHDSLLRDNKDEQLTEEEKMMAWEEYENEWIKKNNLIQPTLEENTDQSALVGMPLRDRLTILYPNYSPEDLETIELTLLEQRDRYKELVNQNETLMSNDQINQLEKDKSDCQDIVSSYLGYVTDFLQMGCAVVEGDN